MYRMTWIAGGKMDVPDLTKAVINKASKIEKQVKNLTLEEAMDLGISLFREEVTDIKTHNVLSIDDFIDITAIYKEVE